MGDVQLSLSEAFAPILSGLSRFHKDHVSRVRRVVDLLYSMLEAGAEATELNQRTADRFLELLKARKTKPVTVKKLFDTFCRLWASVHEQWPDVVEMPPDNPTKMPPHVRKGKHLAEAYPEPETADQRAKDLTLFFERNYAVRRLVGKSICTTRLFQVTLRNFCRFLQRRATLDDLNDETVCRYLSDRFSKVAPHTAAKDRANILALANFAAKKRFISEFLDLPCISLPDLQPEAWTIEDLQRLFQACRNALGYVDGLPANAWWTALHLFVLDSGERTRATLALRWEWIDRTNGRVRVPAAARKGKCKAMFYQLRPETLVTLNSLWRSDREFVFITKGAFTIDAFYYRYKNLLKRAGLPHGRRFKLQRMRRTFASFLEQAGGDATRALAHTSRRVTERSYLDERLIARPSPSSFLDKVVPCSAFAADAPRG